MKIAFTGGGTAGHAITNTILIQFLQECDCNAIYIGSHSGKERELMRELDGVKYYGISTGKWRRSLSRENFTDVFRVVKGFVEAYKILKEERPQLLYSGGGYVSVPAVLAAARLKIPVFIRETDLSMGLANRICLHFAERIYTSFPKVRRIPNGVKTSFNGIFIRPELMGKGRRIDVDIENRKPRCLVLGGSMGSHAINSLVRKNIECLSEKYDIVHICGHGNVDDTVRCNGSYRQLEYVYKGMGSLLADADVVVTRCGSNAILETLALDKKTVCIPIASKSSRGEQVQNADFAQANGNAILLNEAELTGESLLRAIDAALVLDNTTPYKTDKGKLVRDIKAHVCEIMDRASQKMTDDFFDSIRGSIRINLGELSGVELAMYDEIVSAYGEE